MDTTDTPKAVDTTAATPGLAEADTAPKPPEDATILPTIQQTKGETHEAVTDTVQEKFDLEKFWKELPELLNRIDREENQGTVTESLIPELEKLLTPALEAGIDSKDLKYFTLKFFKINKLGRNQVLTAISKTGINRCLQNAKKIGLVGTVRDPLSAYDDFTERLLTGEKLCWMINNGSMGGSLSGFIEMELKNALMSMKMDDMIITQIAQIVFSDYASSIQQIVRKNRHWWHNFNRAHREQLTGKMED